MSSQVMSLRLRDIYDPTAPRTSRGLPRLRRMLEIETPPEDYRFAPDIHDRMMETENWQRRYGEELSPVLPVDVFDVH